MSRIPFVGGNWKCNGSKASITKLLAAWEKKETHKNVDVVIAAPAIYIPLAQEKMRKDFHLASENCYFRSGAFTGTTSVDMLVDFGLKYCVLGHSERRHVFGEKDDVIAKKAAACIEKGITVIACIGELKDERLADKTLEVNFRQLKAYADVIKKEEEWDLMVIAYEPVWAIGTGLTATPKQAQEVHHELRGWLKKNVSEKVANKVRIIYGGSVKPHNADELYKNKDVDGFLVGGASLKENFDVIINATKEK